MQPDHVSAPLLKFTTIQEGCVLHAYPDPATRGEPFTIGVGHTSAAGPPKVYPGLTISEAEAFDILHDDFARGVEPDVNRCIAVPIEQCQYDAIADLCFNVGARNTANSSVVRYLNAGQPQQAADAFMLWNKAQGRVFSGLTRRCEARRKLFLTGDYGFTTGTIHDQAAEQGSVLRIGSAHSDDVAALQRNLTALGLYTGNIDGNFGKKTETAVIAFQTAEGLHADGVVGPATRSALHRVMQANGQVAELSHPVAMAA